MAEKPRSVHGAAFIFALSTSVGFPSIFLLGNQVMRRQMGKKVYKKIARIHSNGKAFITKSLRSNAVAPSSIVQNA